MQEVQQFNFNGAEIRVKVINNDPVFCLADVCAVLEIGNPSQLKTRLNPDGVITNEVIDSMGRTQQATFISEQNLYKVIFQSRKPEAEVFTDWVTGEVLPAIRKTGGYMVSRPDETPDEILSRALLLAKETMDRQAARLAEAETKIREQTKQIEENTEALELAAPKAAFVDGFCFSGGTILVRDFAKHVSQALGMRGFGEKAMFKFLKGNGYMNLNRYPTQDAADMGLFRVSEGLHMLNDGSTEVHHTTRITSRGQTYFFGKIKAKLENEGKWW